jgi:Zn-dependent M28 family amino/carboxypeptidase
VPVWQRGVEVGEVVSPVSQRLALTALGGSEPTPAGGVEAEIVRVSTLEELDQLDASACRGKIVFIDRHMARTSDGSGYGDAVPARSDGASRAARLGAAGLLIRSIGTDRNRLPHTGALTYKKDAPRIPAAALSVPDADLLTRLVRRGGPVRVRFELTCGKKPDALSASVVGEVVGREKPDEIVLVGAHLDSWDLGTGAIDDGAGCGIAIEAARQIAALSPHPRRTIRVVLFANEENGLAGGKTYAKAHAEELARHVASLEADLGDGPPLGFSWNAGPSAEAMLKAIAGLTGALAAGQLKIAKDGGADISPLVPSGVPSLGLMLDASTYFDLHHTANDTLDKIDPATLDRSTAVFAVAAYVLAETPETLERIPEAARAQEAE